jgi:ABC-type antimicrobial peptide transport system permease subunit
MRAVVACARAEMRARVLSILVLAVLLGLGSGAVMTLVAGARRTDSAYDRFAREHLAADMLIFAAFDPVNFADLDFDTVAALPQVAASGRQNFIGTMDPSLTALASDANIGKTINRVKLLEGRMPRDDSVDEVAPSFTLAKARKLRVGDEMTIDFASNEFTPIPTRVRIVGIEASPGEFPPQLAGFGTGGGVLRVSPALHEALKAKDAFSLEFLLLRFKRGAADFKAVNEELSELAQGKPQLNQNLGAQAENVQRSIHLQAVALRIVAALIALIALLVLSQLIARQASIEATESPILRALGMTRGQVSASGLFRSALVGAAGAIIGVVAAAAASPLMPIGLARVAEPDTGFSLDVLVLGAGAIATVVVVMVLAAWPMWKYSKGVPAAPLGAARPSAVARTAAVSGFSPAMSTGISLALESGRGRTAVPVRSSLLSVTIAIVGLAGALTFGAGLDHLLRTPRQYGWNWDARLTTDESQTDVQAALEVLDADPTVAAVALIDTPPVLMDGIPFDAMALQQHKGSLQPRVIEGRSPRAADEIAVGARTLREADAHIGSKVHVSISAISGGGADFTIVGTVVIPPQSDTTRLGSGGVITYEGELRMVPDGFTELPPLTDAFIRLAPGVDRKQALASIEERLPDGYEISTPVRPTDLVNFGQVQNLPLLLAGLVAVLAAATLAHTLTTSIRRRRRDLAILKMLGFVPRQIRWAVAWQATTFMSAALAIGLPIGIVVGRATWSAFARGLGVPPEPATPSLQLLLTVPAAILLANLIAAAPAVIAGRMRPAPALRTE